MYGYSPLKSLKIKNFRNIGDVNIDFTESPIITLLGANEAGKTSVIKAFSMCALHDSPREQKDWIRDDTDMLGVEIDLADVVQKRNQRDRLVGIVHAIHSFRAFVRKKLAQAIVNIQAVRQKPAGTIPVKTRGSGRGEKVAILRAKPLKKLIGPLALDFCIVDFKKSFFICHSSNPL